MFPLHLILPMDKLVKVENTMEVFLSGLRRRIVREALLWLATPYQHQQRCRGIGCDCIGFPIGVCINVGLLPTDIRVPYYSTQWHLHQKQELLVETAIQFGCTEKASEDFLPGDLVFFKIGLACSHTGLLVSPTEFMHASCSDGKVMKRAFDRLWKDKLAKRFFCLPGVED